jgi:NADP-dependent 3-hydroxy acid dehydrogenase YdfG
LALGAGVGQAARDVEKLEGLAEKTDAQTFAVDAIDSSAVAGIFLDTERLLPELDVVIYNPGSHVAGRLAERLRASEALMPGQAPTMSAVIYRNIVITI